MREIRQSGLEGGGAREGAPYPYTRTAGWVTGRKAPRDKTAGWVTGRKAPRDEDSGLGDRAQSAS